MRVGRKAEGGKPQDLRCLLVAAHKDQSPCLLGYKHRGRAAGFEILVFAQALQSYLQLRKIHEFQLLLFWGRG